jgi:hypothetical protein
MLSHCLSFAFLYEKNFCHELECSERRYEET